jgi:hypothetical protein
VIGHSVRKIGVRELLEMRRRKKKKKRESEPAQPSIP